MKSGELYRAPVNDYMVLFPTLEKGVQARVVSDHMGWSAWQCFTVGTQENVNADWWGYELKCKVHYATPNETFLILSSKYVGDALFANVLLGEIQGWIVIEDRQQTRLMRIKESTQS